MMGGVMSRAAIVFVLCLFAWSYEAKAGWWIEVPIVKELEVDCERN